VSCALHALRLHTPRLDLRLGSRDELVQLGHLAENGIHPPGEMPFAIAWSDAIGDPEFIDGFVAFHEDALASCSPEKWSLNWLVWSGDALVGTQGIGAEHFAETRAVATGSWLGQAHQRRGLGTEMRAAVLEFAFGGLGAETARSAWLDGNEASRRVSEKLGYRDAGIRTERPRGEPVVAHEVELSRADWSCPIPVRIEGLTDCLPLFGVNSAP
jgi:RimJ/RimL family protein N-acetyltransferase